MDKGSLAERLAAAKEIQGFPEEIKRIRREQYQELASRVTDMFPRQSTDYLEVMRTGGNFIIEDWRHPQQNHPVLLHHRSPLIPIPGDGDLPEDSVGAIVHYEELFHADKKDVKALAKRKDTGVFNKLRPTGWITNIEVEFVADIPFKTNSVIARHACSYDPSEGRVRGKLNELKSSLDLVDEALAARPES